MINFKKLFDDNDIKTRIVDRRNGWINVNCPFCKNPKDTHFNGNFSQTTPAYNCWRCGKHNWLEALSLVLNTNPIGARKLVSSYSNSLIKKEEKKISFVSKLDMPGYSELTKGEEKYLLSRGFDIKKLQEKFGIRGGGIAGDWSYRIIIPIFFNGKLVSWTGRSILSREFISENEIPRYKNLAIEKSVINPKDIFFNLDNSRKDSVILVEGPFDVLKMGNDCICSLGTSVTEAQKLLLSTRYKKVFISFDNEPSAQEKAHKLGMDLCSLGMDIEIVNICEDFNKNDPGELNEDEVKIIKKELEMI